MRFYSHKVHGKYTERFAGVQWRYLEPCRQLGRGRLEVFSAQAGRQRADPRRVLPPGDLVARDDCRDQESEQAQGP